MWSIPNEDEYWERRREEYERVPKDWKPEPERQILSLDDELDDLEKRIWLQAGRSERAGH